MYIKITQNFLVTRWHLSRPDRGNALGTSIADELLSLCESLENDKKRTTKAVILDWEPVTAASTPIGIAGGDLKELAELHSQEAGGAYARKMAAAGVALLNLPIPVVAVIDGRILGGGVELLLYCDARIATTRATLEFRQLQMGLPMGYGTASILGHYVGLATAQKWLYRAEVVHAEEALHRGLFHELVPDREAGMNSAEKFCNTIIAHSETAFAMQKKMFANTLFTTTERRQALELEYFQTAWRNPSHAAALEKFQKRKS